MCVQTTLSKKKLHLNKYRGPENTGNESGKKQQPLTNERRRFGKWLRTKQNQYYNDARWGTDERRRAETRGEISIHVVYSYMHILCIIRFKRGRTIGGPVALFENELHVSFDAAAHIDGVWQRSALQLETARRNRSDNSEWDFNLVLEEGEKQRTSWRITARITARNRSRNIYYLVVRIRYLPDVRRRSAQKITLVISVTVVMHTLTKN